MVKSILVVGGGSAGWITANLLNATLNRGSNPKTRITLIESPNIPKIGVGEATVPTIRQTLQTIGVDEWDFMRQTDATYKNLIRFVDWKKGYSYDHPFDRVLPDQIATNVPAWLQANTRPRDENEFAKAFSLLTHISDAGLGPKDRTMASFASPFPYAYHLDAIKLAHYLAGYGQKHGITHHLANVTDITLDEHGHISQINTDTGEVHTADLYIDCTGFRSMLHRQKLGVKTLDYSDYLLCDRAVTMRVPHTLKRPERLNTYTTSTAKSAGWIWNIGLRNRKGTGYVYSSGFETEEGAEATLRAHEGEHTKALDVQHIKFKSQRSESAWFGNCVAIGLSGGFLEPLESTGLYLVEFAAKALAELLPYAGQDNAVLAKSYNQQINMAFTEGLEYINLHYCLSDRDDSDFWREVRKPEHVLPSLRDKLELWKIRPVSAMDFTHAPYLFGLPSYEYILYGMGFRPDMVQDMGGSIPDLGEGIRQSLSRLPKHEDLLASI
jgi:tryptophan 7-halogenase